MSIRKKKINIKNRALDTKQTTGENSPLNNKGICNNKETEE